MRVLLYDWLVSGHHENHVRRYTEALQDDHDVVVAVPDELAERVGDLPVEMVPLGPAPDVVDTTRYLSRAARGAARRELDLFREAIRRARPDHAVALYGDGLVRTLAGSPRSEVPATLSIFRPRAHYPQLYGASQTPRERLAARAFDGAVQRWRRRADAHALLTLDAGAAEWWSRTPGAAAYWLPEPLLPAARRPRATAERSGCMVFGALAPRKGIELIEAAITLEPTSLRLVLAGAVEPSYASRLDAAVSAMRAAAATVELTGRWLADQEAVDALAGARCAVLPYPRHYGSSGVLAEAAAVRTPLLVHDWGLLAHEVRAHGLGEAVDCTDPGRLRAAMLRFWEEPGALERHAHALDRYAARHAPQAFRGVVRAVVSGA